MSVRYRLPCPCGRTVPVRPSQAGDSVVCECGESLEVPTLRELRRLDRWNPPSAGRRRRGPVWGRRQVWISVGLIVTLIGLSHGLFLLWTWPRPADVETLSPLETWALWQELRLGANRFPSPAAREAATRELSSQVWSVFALVVTAVGVLTMGGAYVLIRPTRARVWTRRPVRPGGRPTRQESFE
jgi:hypothetical protein